MGNIEAILCISENALISDCAAAGQWAVDAPGLNAWSLSTCRGRYGRTAAEPLATHFQSVSITDRDASQRRKLCAAIRRHARRRTARARRDRSIDTSSGRRHRERVRRRGSGVRGVSPARRTPRALGRGRYPTTVRRRRHGPGGPRGPRARSVGARVRAATRSDPSLAAAVGRPTHVTVRGIPIRRSRPVSGFALRRSRAATMAFAAFLLGSVYSMTSSKRRARALSSISAQLVAAMTRLSVESGSSRIRGWR